MTREARFWIKCERREAGRPQSPVGTMYLVLYRIDQPRRLVNFFSWDWCAISAPGSCGVLDFRGIFWFGFSPTSGSGQSRTLKVRRDVAAPQSRSFQRRWLPRTSRFIDVYSCRQYWLISGFQGTRGKGPIFLALQWISALEVHQRCDLSRFSCIIRLRFSSLFWTQ